MKTYWRSTKSSLHSHGEWRRRIDKKNREQGTGAPSLAAVWAGPIDLMGALRQQPAQGLPSVPVATLASHYGSFAGAVAVAVRLHVRGTAGRVAHRIPAPGRSWRPTDVLDALDRIREELGHPPRKFGCRRRRGPARRRPARGSCSVLLAVYA